MPPMLVCPTCGHKTKAGEDFCPKCGTPLKPAAGGPAPTSPSSPSLALGLGVVVIGIVALLVLAVVGLGVLALIFQKPASAPTTLQLTLPNQAEVNSSTAVKVLLVGPGNAPVANRTVTIYDDSRVSVTTDSSGAGQANFIFNRTGAYWVRAVFSGDAAYLNSTSEKQITIVPPSCNDSTAVGQCSRSVGYYCYQNKTLAFNCGECGCSSGLVCYDNYCLTPEQKTAYLIDRLQNSVVYIENSYVSGSGVIMAQDLNNSLTLIVTNEHVVHDAESVEDLRVTTRDGRTIPASRILVAPHNMDLAVVILLGVYGMPAPFNASQPYYQGMEVMALGSPLGIQGSVSNGIISNIVSTSTDSGYSFTAIQTDAAINPGNSGGGLFLKSNGNLVGINSFILTSDYGAEGLGFAIDENSLNDLPQMQYWSDFVPTSKCSDNTPYGSCSVHTEGKYCSNGNLVSQCTSCGCAQGYTCISGTEQCFYCPNGDAFVNQEKTAAVCCPTGWQAYGDGTLICCPPGTVGYRDGTCG